MHRIGKAGEVVIQNEKKRLLEKHAMQTRHHIVSIYISGAILLCNNGFDYSFNVNWKVRHLNISSHTVGTTTKNDATTARTTLS